MDLPQIGFGTANTSPTPGSHDDVAAAAAAAFRLGCRHFDCAPLYGNQIELGRGLFAPILRGELHADVPVCPSRNACGGSEHTAVKGRGCAPSD